MKRRKLLYPFLFGAKTKASGFPFLFYQPLTYSRNFDTSIEDELCYYSICINTKFRSINNFSGHIYRSILYFKTNNFKDI